MGGRVKLRVHSWHNIIISIRQRQYIQIRTETPFPSSQLLYEQKNIPHLANNPNRHLNLIHIDCVASQTSERKSSNVNYRRGYILGGAAITFFFFEIWLRKCHVEMIKPNKISFFSVNFHAVFVDTTHNKCHHWLHFSKFVTNYIRIYSALVWFAA